MNNLAIAGGALTFVAGLIYGMYQCFSELSARDKARTCSICQGNKDESIKTLPCGHAFHSSCIRAQIQINAICPVCRKSI